jgi:hypothetical protein
VRGTSGNARSARGVANVIDYSRLAVFLP